VARQEARSSHTVKTTTVARFTHQEYTTSSCYTVHTDNVHVFIVIVSFQLHSCGCISTHIQILEKIRKSVWCIIIIIIIIISSSSSSSSSINGGCIVLLHVVAVTVLIYKV